jgi:competence protein ComEC
MGDIEKPIELDLVGSGLIAATTVVVAAHHGSRSSSTAALVKAAHADWVIFSAGYRNRWGFPKDEVLARWQQAGTVPISTIQAGATTVTFVPGQSIVIQRYRQGHRRYWQTS